MELHSLKASGGLTVSDKKQSTRLLNNSAMYQRYVLTHENLRFHVSSNILSLKLKVFWKNIVILF